MSDRLSSGIHEILRYSLPGYTFLFILLVPWNLSNIFPIFSLYILNKTESVILLGPFLGYFIYYVYYPFFRKCVYNNKSVSSQRIAKHLNEKVDNIKVRSFHGYLGIKLDKEIRDSLNFQFSVFHSIGAMIIAIILANIICFLVPAFVLTSYSFKNYWDSYWVVIPISIFLIIFLCIEYRYRTKLAIEIEDRHMFDLLDRYQRKLS